MSFVNVCNGGTPFSYYGSTDNSSNVAACFDGSETVYGGTPLYLPYGTSCTIGYIFSLPRIVTQINLYPQVSWPSLGFKNFTVTGSNNTTNGMDGNWTTLATGLNTTNIVEWNSFVLNNNNSYKAIALTGLVQDPGNGYRYILWEAEIQMMAQISDGGTITQVNGRTYHTFTSSGSFIPYNNGTIDILVVGGGGGGGGHAAGAGGGAGGYVSKSLSVNKGTSYNIVIGDGGIGGTVVGLNGYGTNGSNSSFDSTVAFGGGYGGGGNPAYNGNIGGSGGGGGGISGSSPANGTINQGKNGGTNAIAYGYYGGGGGGASTSGGNASAGLGGSGGAGIQWINGNYYAGGGGGGCHDSGTGGAGGIGGGANGASYGYTNGTDGASNTGGGGAGAGGKNGIVPSYGGKGGSGIVIVSYTELSLNQISSTSLSPIIFF